MRQKLLAVIALFAYVLAGCADPMGRPNDVAESQSDYGPGFFESKIDMTEEDREGGENNSELPHPDFVETIVREKGTVSSRLSFPQTEWNECVNKVTGNYVDFACAQRRGLSVILNSYLQQRLIACVDKGMAAQSGGGLAQAIHIVHAGIAADPNHSPLSLHSHKRAIDVKSIRATLANGSVREYTYSKLGNRTFYTELRKCWGNTVNVHNGCPLISGNPMLTGSIGWENSDHGRHMHLSVPYCVNGAYGSGVWRR